MFRKAARLLVYEKDLNASCRGGEKHLRYFTMLRRDFIVKYDFSGAFILPCLKDVGLKDVSAFA